MANGTVTKPQKSPRQQEINNKPLANGAAAEATDAAAAPSKKDKKPAFSPALLAAASRAGQPVASAPVAPTRAAPTPSLPPMLQQTARSIPPSGVHAPPSLPMGLPMAPPGSQPPLAATPGASMQLKALLGLAPSPPMPTPVAPTPAPAPAPAPAPVPASVPLGSKGAPKGDKKPSFSPALLAAAARSGVGVEESPSAQAVPAAPASVRGTNNKGAQPKDKGGKGKGAAAKGDGAGRSTPRAESARQPAETADAVQQAKPRAATDVTAGPPGLLPLGLPPPPKALASAAAPPLGVAAEAGTGPAASKGKASSGPSSAAMAAMQRATASSQQPGAVAVAAAGAAAGAPPSPGGKGAAKAGATRPNGAAPVELSPEEVAAADERAAKREAEKKAKAEEIKAAKAAKAEEAKAAKAAKAKIEKEERAKAKEIAKTKAKEEAEAREAAEAKAAAIRAREEAEAAKAERERKMAGRMAHAGTQYAALMMMDGDDVLDDTDDDDDDEKEPVVAAAPPPRAAAVAATAEEEDDDDDDDEEEEDEDDEDEEEDSDYEEVDEDVEAMEAEAAEAAAAAAAAAAQAATLSAAAAAKRAAAKRRKEGKAEEAAPAAVAPAPVVWWGSEMNDGAQRLGLKTVISSFTKKGEHKLHPNEDRQASFADLGGELAAKQHAAAKRAGVDSAESARFDDGAPDGSTPPPHAFFGVYDGHGGSSAAQHLASRLHLLLAADLALWRESPREAMLNAFALAESELRQVYETNPEDKSGSCACVGMLRGRRLVVASVGDCRMLLIRGENCHESCVQVRTLPAAPYIRGLPSPCLCVASSHLACRACVSAPSLLSDDERPPRNRPHRAEAHPALRRSDLRRARVGSPHALAHPWRLPVEGQGAGTER